MVKNGVEALSTTIPTYAKNKAQAIKMQVFAAFTHAKLYFLRASQKPGCCNTTKMPLKLKIIVLANFTFQKLD